MNENRQVDPIPEEFDSYEAAANFWDEHDTTDYPQAFSDVSILAERRAQYCEIEIDADVAEALAERAELAGISIGNLASDLLRRQLAASE